jgi:hypothetical protein
MGGASYPLRFTGTSYNVLPRRVTKSYPLKFAGGIYISAPLKLSRDYIWKGLAFPGTDYWGLGEGERSPLGITRGDMCWGS